MKEIDSHQADHPQESRHSRPWDLLYASASREASFHSPYVVPFPQLRWTGVSARILAPLPDDDAEHFQTLFRGYERCEAIYFVSRGQRHGIHGSLEFLLEEPLVSSTGGIL